MVDDQPFEGACIMIRTGLSLIAAAVALPAISFAASPAAPQAVLVPVVFAPMPQLVPMVMPAAFVQQMAQMQQQMRQQMALLQRVAFAPLPLPTSFTPGAIPNGVMQVSMVSVGGPGGVCSEQMQIVPGPNGQTRVFVRRSGNACAPLPTALGKPPGETMSPTQATPARPANALPPPSKLLYADYPIPAAVHPARQG